MVQKVTRGKFTTYRPDLWEKRQNLSKARQRKKTPEVSEVEKR